MSRLLGVIVVFTILAAPLNEVPALRLHRGDDGTDVLPHVWTGDNEGFVHWDLRTVPNCEVPWSPDLANGTADIANNDEFIAVENAFATWQAVTPSILKFKKVAMQAGAMPAGNKDGHNVIGWTSAGLGGATLALTTITHSPSTTDGSIEQVDIRFNDNFTWGIIAHGANMNGKTDVETVALHEIGHFLGLPEATDNMACTVNPGGPIMNPGLWDGGKDDVWLVAPGNQKCGTDVGANTDIIGPGNNGVINTPLNTCTGCLTAGDDVITAGNVTAGPNGIVETVIEGLANHELGAYGRNAINFLYTQDLGDAPDKDRKYPTVVQGADDNTRKLNGITFKKVDRGARHHYGTKDPTGENGSFVYEWLGSKVGPECEPNKRDPHDDGLVFRIVTVEDVKVLEIDVTVSTAMDADNNGHDYNARHLYLNVWIDWNQNRRWGETTEHPIKSEVVDPTTVGTPEVKQFTVVIPAGALTKDRWWVRARLDWGEDVGVVKHVDNAALPAPLRVRFSMLFGEVEDHVIHVPKKDKKDISDQGRDGVQHHYFDDYTHALYQNFPNPFNPETNIRFELPGPSHVLLAVYDVRGRLVIRLVDGELRQGLHEVTWNGRDATVSPVTSGVYFYRIDSSFGTLTRKMIILK